MQSTWSNKQQPDFLFNLIKFIIWNDYIAIKWFRFEILGQCDTTTDNTDGKMRAQTLFVTVVVVIGSSLRQSNEIKDFLWIKKIGKKTPLLICMCIETRIYTLNDFSVRCGRIHWNGRQFFSEFIIDTIGTVRGPYLFTLYLHNNSSVSLIQFFDLFMHVCGE